MLDKFESTTLDGNIFVFQQLDMSLAEFIDDNTGNIEISDFLRISEQIFEMGHQLKINNLVNNDIKSENMMLDCNKELFMIDLDVVRENKHYFLD